MMNEESRNLSADSVVGGRPIRWGGTQGKVEAAAPDVRTVAKGGIIQFFGTGTNRAIGLLFVAIAIRLLGAAGFGVYRQISQILMMTSTIATLGFDTALLRSIAQARAREEESAIRTATRTAVISVTVASVILFLLLFFAAVPIARGFADEPSRQAEMAFLIRLGTAYVPIFALAQVLSAGTTGYKTVLPSVLIGNVIQPISFLLLSIAAILAGYGVAGAVGGLAGSALIALLAAVWFFRRLFRGEQPHLEAREGPIPSHASFRSMTAFALPQAGQRILGFGSAGTILLGLLGTDREVALFAVAVSLQSVVLIFPQAFLAIWRPMVVDLVERNEMERLGALYHTVTRWVASCSFGFIIGLLVLPEPFVRILGGEAVPEAALLTSIIALGTIFSVGTGPCGMLVLMAGYPAVNLANGLILTSAYVIAAWFIVPIHGVIGIAVIHGAAIALSNLLLVIAAKWLTDLQPFDRSFLKPLAATVVAGVLLLSWRLFVERILVLDLLALALAGVAYCGSLWMMGMNAEDRIVYERVRARYRGLLSTGFFSVRGEKG